MSDRVEEWRSVVGFEKAYEVSCRGSVRSIPRVAGKNRVYGGLKVGHIEKRSGYVAVMLCMDGKQTTGRVHNLVLEAFVGPRPYGAVCRHLNGDPADNRVENLAWGTYLENSRDAQVHGTWQHGEEHHNAKLTAVQAQAIMHLRGKMSASAIGDAFGVSAMTVQDIHSGRTWRYENKGRKEGSA